MSGRKSSSARKKLTHRTAPPPLTAREVRFCCLWAEDGNATAAFKAAGYKSASANAAGVAAFALLRKPKIRAYIRELQTAAADAARASVEVIAQGLFRAAFADRRKLFAKDGTYLPPHLWPDDVAAAVEQVETEEVYAARGKGRGGKPKAVGRVCKVRTARRLDALKVLAQWRRMLDAPGGPAGGTGPGGPPLDVLGRLTALLVVGGEADPNVL